MSRGLKWVVWIPVLFVVMQAFAEYPATMPPSPGWLQYYGTDSGSLCKQPNSPVGTDREAVALASIDLWDKWPPYTWTSPQGAFYQGDGGWYDGKHHWYYYTHRTWPTSVGYVVEQYICQVGSLGSDSYNCPRIPNSRNNQNECCPCGYVYTSGSCVLNPTLFSTNACGAVAPDPKNHGDQCPGGLQVSNPINAGTGNKYQRESDYTGSGPFPLGLVRYFNSQANQSGIAGSNWNLFSRLTVVSGTSVTVTRADGRVLAFSLVSGQWQADADVQERLVPTGSGWQLSLPGGGAELFDANGILVASRHTSGLALTVSYPSASQTVMTDSLGRSLVLDLDAQGRLDHLTDPAGGLYRYTYDASGNLATVLYPDATLGTDTDNPRRSYLYEDTRFPHALTGIQDESGQRFATWSYDAQGRALSSEHAGGAERVTLSFDSPSATTVTDALGTARTYGLTSVLGVVKNTGVSQPGGPGCNASASSLSYDANGNVASRTDFNGTTTTYTYDLARNLETQRVEASGSTVARTVSTQWHPTWRLQTRLAEPKKITTWVYNGQPDPTNGNAIASCAPSDAYVIDTTPIAVLCKQVEQPTTDTTGAAGFAAAADGPAQVWSYTYDRTGHVLTANGPRTDVADITTYAYWPADAICPGAAEGTGMDKGCRGELQRVTDALGPPTDYLKYNPHGQVLQMTDANGVAVSFTYDPRLRLTSRTVDNKTTTYGYTPWGGLERVARPDLSYTTYTYDPAHRLTDIADNVGNATHYVLDAAGNILQADTSDPQGSLARRIKTDFDTLGRPWKHYNAAGYITETRHDAMDQLNQLIDAKTRSTLYTRDALGRLQTIEDPQSPTHGLTQMTHDGQDALASLTAPNGAQTSFTANGLGQVKQEQSADRGTLTATYDDAGNLKSRTDATGRKSLYSYDALNRLTQVQNLNASGQVEETLTYTWDAAAGCAYGIGRLCQLADGAGTTTFSYDARGNLLTQTRTEAGFSYTTSYTPDAADRTVALIAPSGALLNRGRDAAGRTTQLNATVGSTTQTVVDNLEYDGAGRVTSEVRAGNQLSLSTYDSDGKLSTGLATAQQPTVSLALAKPYGRLGEALQITASLSAPQAGGNIELCEGDCTGANLLGQQTLSNGVASFSVASLPRGVHRLWARYVAQPPFVDAASAKRTAFVAVPPFLLIETP
jgi:YD repeat-containing protein